MLSLNESLILEMAADEFESAMAVGAIFEDGDMMDATMGDTIPNEVKCSVKECNYEGVCSECDNYK